MNVTTEPSTQDHEHVYMPALDVTLTDAANPACVPWSITEVSVRCTVRDCTDHLTESHPTGPYGYLILETRGQPYAIEFADMLLPIDPRCTLRINPRITHRPAHPNHRNW